MRATTRKIKLRSRILHGLRNISAKLLSLPKYLKSELNFKLKSLFRFIALYNFFSDLSTKLVHSKERSFSKRMANRAFDDSKELIKGAFK